MPEPTHELTRQKLIEGFESNGFAVFSLREERALYEDFMGYVRENNVPIYTDIDRKEGLITITRRTYGSLEG